MTSPRSRQPLEALDDYLSRTTTEEDAAPLEEALFDAAAQGQADALVFFDKLRRSLADLAERGSYDVTLTVAELEALQRTTKLKVRVFDAVTDAKLDAGEVLAGVDLALFSFPVPLAGATRVDLELGIGDQTLLRLPDVKVDREHDRVILCCEGDLARASFRNGIRTRVIAVEGEQRRTLADFLYDTRV